MNIIGIFAISLVISLGVLLAGLTIYEFSDSYSTWPFGLIVGSTVASFVVCISIGIGLTTDAEKVYVDKYLAQKATIEQSLASETLSGTERVAIVNKAIDINGELAERMSRFERWYFVCYEDDIYDGIEFIEFE